MEISSVKLKRFNVLVLFFFLSPRSNLTPRYWKKKKKKFILNFPRPSREIDVKSIYKMIFILILLLLALSPSPRVNKREIPLSKVRFQK